MDQLLFLLTKRQQEQKVELGDLTKSPETVKIENTNTRKPALPYNRIHVPKRLPSPSNVQQPRRMTPPGSFSLSTVYSGKVKKNVKNFQYVSPYILEARRKATKRAQNQPISGITKKISTIQRSSNNFSSKDWNMDTKTPGLFDPTLRKTEIFKPESNRNSRRVLSSSDINTKPNDSPDQTSLFKSQKSMIVRTNKDEPRYKPGKDRRRSNNISNDNGQNNQKISHSLLLLNNLHKKSPLRSSITPDRSQHRSTELSHYISPSNSNDNNHRKDGINKNDSDYESDFEENVQETLVEVKTRSTSPFDERLVELLTDEHIIEREDKLYDYQHPPPPPSSSSSSLSHPSYYRTPNQMEIVSTLERNRDSNTIFQPSVDMMNSMAKLMDAVGQMVTRAADTVNSAKLSQRQHRSLKLVSDGYKATGTITRQEIENHVREQFMSNPSAVNIRDIQDTKAYHNNAIKTIDNMKSMVSEKIKPDVSSLTMSKIAPYNQTIQSNRDLAMSRLNQEFIPIMSMNNISTVHSTSGKMTKSTLMDLILTKLQALERNEREISQLIKKPSQVTNKSKDDIYDTVTVLDTAINILDDACKLPMPNSYSSSYSSASSSSAVATVAIESNMKYPERSILHPTTKQQELSDNVVIQPNHSQLNYGVESGFSNRAPSIVFTHDTALKSSEEELMDYDPNHPNSYNHPDPSITKTMTMTMTSGSAFLSHTTTSSSGKSGSSGTLTGTLPSFSDHSSQQSILSPLVTTKGLTSDLLVILDSARGDFSRRTDEKARYEYEKREMMRKGLEHLPYIEPLHYDVANDLKQYQKNMEKARKLKQLTLHERGFTLKDIIERFGDHVLHQLIEEVEGEVEEFIEEYANHFTTKI